MAERARHLPDARHAAREPAALHRRREARQQPGDGAVAHHGVSREGEDMAAAATRPPKPCLSTLLSLPGIIPYFTLLSRCPPVNVPYFFSLSYETFLRI